jgi:acyl-CoA synthetase (AMP-forming)/AMP-acid ligase II
MEAHWGDRVVKCLTERPAHLDILLKDAAHQHADRVAVVDSSETLRYADLDRRVEHLAAALQNRGIIKGDRVALLVRNSAEFIQLLCATIRIGAVAVPLNVREQEPELRHILRHCGAKALFYSTDLEDRLPRSEHVESLAICIGVGPGPLKRGTPLTELAAADAAVTPIQIDEEDLAVIIYTSGTTGAPKGAMLTHLNLVHAALQYRHALALTPDDRCAVAAPMSHVTGLTGGILMSVSAASTLIVMPEFKAERFLELASRERMTVTIMVPAMYKLCLLSADFAAADLSAWRIGGYGGAIMPAPLIEELAAKLPGLGLMNCYGATETASPVAMMPATETRGHEGSVGRASPCGEILIMDDRGHALSPGEVGEIWLRSATTAKGYWQDPAATAREFTAGFWHSGDIGSLDAAGYLTLLDRKKDMINRGGFKIFAAEVEEVLARHPGIAESAVVGKRCPVLGERVHVFVVPTSSDFDINSARALCAANLSDFKVPETFTVRATALPRNANGKVLKQQLRNELDHIVRPR